MKMLIVGASKGLGRAFVEGLGQAGDVMVGVSRTKPQGLALPAGVALQWIEANMGEPLAAATRIAEQAPADLDVLIYNLGLWEAQAFTEHYDFLADDDEALVAQVGVNITATLLLLKRLIPRLLTSSRPRLILTGSTSGLRQSGRPEVTFGATKFALNGMADALREGFRDRGLAVTCLQLGYLNTEDALSVPVAEAARRGQGQLIPVHDVVSVVRTLLALSDASFVRELVMPAMADERF
jgi:NAD(P)-dependent dehydrogenase (short-subunit alcohol dehydrogenase family)